MSVPTPYFPCSPPAPGSPRSAHLYVDLPAVDISCKGNLTACGLLWLSSFAWHVFKVRPCCHMSLDEWYLTALSEKSSVKKQVF